MSWYGNYSIATNYSTGFQGPVNAYILGKG